MSSCSSFLSGEAWKCLVRRSSSQTWLIASPSSQTMVTVCCSWVPTRRGIIPHSHSHGRVQKFGLGATSALKTPSLDVEDVESEMPNVSREWRGGILLRSWLESGGHRKFHQRDPGQSLDQNLNFVKSESGGTYFTKITATVLASPYHVLSVGMTQHFFVFFVPGDLDLWPRNSN